MIETLFHLGLYRLESDQFVVALAGIGEIRTGPFTGHFFALCVDSNDRGDVVLGSSVTLLALREDQRVEAKEGP